MWSEKFDIKTQNHQIFQKIAEISAAERLSGQLKIQEMNHLSMEISELFSVPTGLFDRMVNNY